MTKTTSSHAAVANCNIARFNSMENAISYRNNRNRYHPPILMGCDGKFWVASTNREAGRLIKAGYEAI